MKKIFLAVALVALMAGTTACGGSDNKEGDKKEQAADKSAEVEKLYNEVMAATEAQDYAKVQELNEKAEALKKEMGEEAFEAAAKKAMEKYEAAHQTNYSNDDAGLNNAGGDEMTEGVMMEEVSFDEPTAEEAEY